MSLFPLIVGWLVVFTLGSYLLEWYVDRVDPYDPSSFEATLSDWFDDTLTTWGPLTLIHTQYGLDLIERMSKWRIWGVWGVLGWVTFLAWMLSALGLMVTAAIRITRNPSSATITQPRNYLVVPGVNDFIPMSAAGEIVIALLVAMLVHEGGHAIYCRVGDIEIDSTGLVMLGGFIPMGAFVEPDGQSQHEASRWAQMQMIAAGVMNNTLVVVLSLVALVALTSLITVAPGAGLSGVAPGSPADEAGLGQSDLVVGVNGQDVTSPEEFEQALAAAGDDETVTVELADGTTKTVERDAFVSGITKTVTDGEVLQPGTVITHVDGVEITTAVGFVEAARSGDAPMMSLKTENGDTVSVPRGVISVPQSDSAASRGGLPEGQAVAITSVAGTDTTTTSDLSEAIEGREPGSEVTVTALTHTEDGWSSEETYTIELGSRDGEAFLGVATTPGIGGVSVSDFGVGFYPADKMLSLIQGDGVGMLQYVGIILALPFGTLVGLSHNFPAFTPTVQPFFDVAHVSGGLEPAVFFITSVVFWLAWLNLNLALFNALPTFALDGGHFARVGVKSILDRLGVNPDGRIGSVATYVVLVGTLAIVAATVVIPLL